MLTPQEKKKLSYARDHVNRSSENQKAWRKAKPLKKRKAVRSIRKAVSDILRSKEEDLDSSPKLLSLKQKKIEDWGVQNLGDHITQQKKWRSERAELRKVRKKKTPNQSLQTMTTAVTDCAAHTPRQLRSCLI
jgi:putative protein kinase ArgK-like GTPase of G3E family